jgi:hypothetical protein
VVLAAAPGFNLSSPCGRFGISRQAGYTWLKRYQESGRGALVDRSRRPRTSPGKSTDQLWGGRKIKARPEQLGHAGIPAASTVTAILHRRGLISPEASEAAAPVEAVRARAA